MSTFGRSFPRYPQNLAGLSAGQFSQTVTASGDVIASVVNITKEKIVNGFETIMGMLTINGDQTINGNLVLGGNLQAGNNSFSPIPTGVIISYTGDPSGINFTEWLACDGRSYSNIAYANLYSVIGETYGSDMAGTFKVPDLRGRVGVGVNGSANVVTQSPNELGNTGGESSHLLTIPEIPAHFHSGSTNVSGAHVHAGFTVTGTSDVSGTHQHGPFNATVTGTHQHSITYGTTPVVVSTIGPTTNVPIVQKLETATMGGVANAPSTQTWNGSTAGTGAHQHSVSLTGITDNDGPHTHLLIIGIDGNNNMHNNLQPYLIVNYFIKT